jgi:hypothetical protein
MSLYPARCVLAFKQENSIQEGPALIPVTTYFHYNDNRMKMGVEPPFETSCVLNIASLRHMTIGSIFTAVVVRILILLFCFKGTKDEHVTVAFKILFSFPVIYSHENQNVQEFNIIVVLYGCEFWSLNPRVKRGPSLFENQVFKGTTGAKKWELTGGWRS